uniref:PID domain-containing protein n=2 Tax=Cacopsylla melanoneura TaxID=428564 RepID=A0A8D8UMW4_9HEMI
MAFHRNGMNDATPICRCRVLYLGSAVPHITKDGLQGIQEPLRELYPEQGALGARGIDSWLSVWSNGLLLENVDENHKKITRFFPIETLHYCAAVRYVLVPEKLSSSQPRFLPLDSPFARAPNPSHPPLFAAILRRTTGIKVLECHTFICKREMAANALVRCCFHAYADSSYAKQIDTNSVYGTLRNGDTPSSVDKVDGWKRNGSTLTLNSTVNSNTNDATIELSAETSNSADEISIYNGDENHKIWTGSTRDLSENIYGDYGATIKSSKSNRPRQILNAQAPPPPPVSKEEKPKKSKDKMKKKKTSKEESFPSLNGSLYRGRSSSSLGGTLVRPKHGHMYSSGSMLRPASSQLMLNGYGPPMSPPGPSHMPPGPHHMMPPGPPLGPPPMLMIPTTLPHPKKGKNSKPSKNGSVILPGRPPHMMPPPSLMPMPPHPMYMTSKKHKHPPMAVPLTMEEPIYMPSARPLSPIASYQPGQFPHEAYLMQQYATIDAKNSKKKSKKNKKQKGPPIIPIVPIVNGGPPGPPSVMNGHGPLEMMQAGMPNGHHPGMPNGHHPGMHNGHHPGMPNGHHPGMPNGQHPGMHNGHHPGMSNGHHPDMMDDEILDDESPYNTGIYRKKGHLNERAFSYSIRQEHRSRSYGSLANLKFASPPMIPNGSMMGSKEELKKEREIMQLMQDLDLSGDELERSEVPPTMYQQPAQRKMRR